jgi:hypothetical protein
MVDARERVAVQRRDERERPRAGVSQGVGEL